MANTDQTINEHRLRFIGQACVMEGLEPDKSYRVIINADCVSKEKRSRQDGTYDMTYKLKILDVALKDEVGDVMIVSKDAKSWSQKMRFAIIQMNEEYDEIAPLIIANLEEIIQEYKYHR